MSSGTEKFNSTATTAVVELCVAQKNWFLVGFMPLDAIAICLNLLLLVASMIDKKKLQRQNYIVASVNSALLSHIVYLSLKIWGTSANIMAEDSPEMLGIEKAMWTACEAGAASIGFGVVANASSLIYVTLDSTFVAARGELNHHHASEKDPKSKLIFKKRVSILLMAVSWIVPITFITVATVTWNCAKQCRCPSGSYVGEVCPHEYRCSRLLKPLTTTFLLINVGLWALEIIALIAMIAKKGREFKNSITRVNSATSSPDGNENNRVLEINSTNEYDKKKPRDPPTERIKNPGRARRQRVNLNPRFRFATILTILLIVCFVPVALSIIIDTSVPDANLEPAMITSILCLYTYMLVCPLLVLKYLPNLRASVFRILQKILCCCS